MQGQGQKWGHSEEGSGLGHHGCGHVYCKRGSSVGRGGGKGTRSAPGDEARASGL